MMAIVANLSYARPPAFAKSGRIITVEHWGHAEAIVWAVQQDRVVVYRVFDTDAPDELLADIPIAKAQVEKIKQAVSAIPKELRSRLYRPRGVLDGTMLRLTFTTDGQFASDRIEVQNLWFPWLGDIVAAISNVVPEARKIRFKEAIEKRNRRPDLPIETISIDEYYGEANQPPQPPSL